MLVSRIELQNFRGYRHFVADLHPGMTVFVGANGAGKSAVLDGLSVGIGTLLLACSVSTRSIQDDEVRRFVFKPANGLPSLEREYPVVVSCTGTLSGTTVDWKRELRSKGGKTTWGDAAEMRRIARELFDGMHPDQQDGPLLPIIAFYSAFRAQQKRNSTLKTEGLGSRLNAYVDCLDPSSDHKLLTTWMRDLELARVQQLEHGDAGPERLALEAVESAVLGCVPRAKRFWFNLRYKELHFEFEDGTFLPFSMLSDGYRQFVGMVADIAWRTVQLNPHLGRNAPAESPGVVLIDEIELHLHPAWQRRVLGDLRRSFPMIQFVVTTHSPQVVSAAKREWMRLLIPGEDRAQTVGPVEGRDSNVLLEDVFGVSARPTWAEDAIATISAAIEGDDVETARLELGLLEEKWGDDPALVALRWETEIAEAGLD